MPDPSLGTALTRQILEEDIKALLDQLQGRGWFLSVTFEQIRALDDVELIFVRRHLRDTLRTLGGGSRGD